MHALFHADFFFFAEVLLTYMASTVGSQEWFERFGHSWEWQLWEEEKQKLWGPWEGQL